MSKRGGGNRSALRDFIASEATGGLVLIAAVLLALIAANLPATAAWYDAALHLRTGPVLAPDLGPMTVHLWINDGAMALFFFVVGLEIKRELIDGELARPDRRRLPFIAAAAGMAVPAFLFLAVTGEYPALRGGWAIPAATDIAFAIGVLALLGPRVPSSLKLLLTTIAIVDDMGAVAIIAAVYTPAIHVAALGGALLAVVVLYVMNRRGVVALPAYLAGFAALWLFTLQSGIHATIAGVVAAMLVPVKPSPGAPDKADSPLHRLEHLLNPVVAYVVVPLFGFANAGVALSGLGWDVLARPLVLGIGVGLVVGKQLGILGAIWGADRLGIARKPASIGWRQLHGMALIAGIGFTMSLFIGDLAFPPASSLAREVKVGVLTGSLVSALAGVAVLLYAPRQRRP